MPEVFDYIKPFPLLNPREPMGRARAARDATLTGAEVFERGDLVHVEATGGNAEKVTVTTTATNVLRMAFAAGPWDIAPLDATRYSYYVHDTRGVPLDTVRDGHLAVFTYQADAADNANHEFASADMAAVRSGVSRELAYNTARNVMTIRDGSTTPHVKMRYVFKGAVADSNVQVACEILPAHRLEV